MADDDHNDEIWLSHLRAHPNEWIALTGDYPFRLVGHGATAVDADAMAQRNGVRQPTLFFVPPPYPIVTTPFP